MDPQTASPHQEDPNNAGMHSGEEEPHPEKQSVMKRVRAKAKKIKHSLTGHGHAHEEHDDHSGELDEEDDEDEEMAEDPPIDDSAATKTAPTWGEENLAKAKDTLGKPAVKEEHPQASAGTHPIRPHGTPVDSAIPQTRPHAPANTTADSFSTGTHPARPPGIPADLGYETHAPVKPLTHTSVPGIHQTGVPDLPTKVDRGQEIAVDPSAPKDRHDTHTPSNYQSKVVDPIGVGGEEVGITPITHSFGKMNVHGESEPKTEHHLPTGIHDQFSSSEGHEPLTRSEEQQYKLSSANSAIDKAATATNVPASKLGYASQDPINKSEEQRYDDRDMPQNQSTAGNAPSATSILAEKAASLKNVVSSKLGYGQEPTKKAEEQQHENRGYTPGNETHEPINKSEEQSFDSKSDTPQNQSTYTGMLSSAAFSAKNVVASKFGYGAKEETHAAPEIHERDVHGDNETTKSPQAGGYGSKIASTLAPVYGKVSGAGSAVLSKLPGTGTGNGTGTGTETNKQGGVVGSDKGASVKEYLVEKSRPGEEDRALSQVITDVLGSKRKEENVEPTGTAARRPSREVFSDAIHNRKEESEPGKSSLPMEKVTESEEVKKQLGLGDEDSQNRVASESGKPGEGVVDRLKGAVTSWFGKGGEPQPSEASHDSHEGTGAFLDTRSGGEVQGQGHEVVGGARPEESSK